jgi:hypothetical protein
MCEWPFVGDKHRDRLVCKTRSGWMTTGSTDEGGSTGMPPLSIGMDDDGRSETIVRGTTVTSLVSWGTLCTGLTLDEIIFGGAGWGESQVGSCTFVRGDSGNRSVSGQVCAMR